MVSMWQNFVYKYCIFFRNSFSLAETLALSKYMEIEKIMSNRLHLSPIFNSGSTLFPLFS